MLGVGVDRQGQPHDDRVEGETALLDRIETRCGILHRIDPDCGVAGPRRVVDSLSEGVRNGGADDHRQAGQVVGEIADVIAGQHTQRVAPGPVVVGPLISQREPELLGGLRDSVPERPSQLAGRQPCPVTTAVTDPPGDLHQEVDGLLAVGGQTRDGFGLDGLVHLAGDGRRPGCSDRAVRSDIAVQLAQRRDQVVGVREMRRLRTRAKLHLGIHRHVGQRSGRWTLGDQEDAQPVRIQRQLRHARPLDRLHLQSRRSGPPSQIHAGQPRSCGDGGTRDPVRKGGWSGASGLSEAWRSAAQGAR